MPPKMCKPVGLCKLKCNYLLAIEVKITPVVLFFAQIVSSPMQLCLKDVRYPPDMNAMAHFLKCRNLKLRAPITYSLHIIVNPPALPLSVFLMDGVHHFEVDEQAILKIQVIALQEQLKNKTTDYQLFENGTLIQKHTILHTVLSRSFAPRTGCQPNTQVRVGLSSIPLLDLAPERVSNRMKLLPAPLRVSGFAF